MPLPGIDSLDSFGGALNNDSPVDDPTTDRDAGQMNTALEDVAGMTHTVARAFARVTLSATAPALTASNGSDATWGNSVPPVPTRSGTGVVVLTWPATVTDELGITQPLLLRWVKAHLEGAFGATYQSVTTANSVTIYLANLVAGAYTAADFAATVLYVEVG